MPFRLCISSNDMFFSVDSFYHIYADLLWLQVLEQSQSCKQSPTSKLEPSSEFRYRPNVRRDRNYRTPTIC